MKITKDVLKQLIKEELGATLNEQSVDANILKLIKRMDIRIKALESKVKQLTDFNQKMGSVTASTFDPADVDKILKRDQERARKDLDFLRRATGKNLERER